ncbi:EAL domain-containing protein [Microbacteriaceae bacterium K1510]|nr:EAL domain-containing protein [Microbacteriaceae bacterium K1510]
MRQLIMLRPRDLSIKAKLSTAFGLSLLLIFTTAIAALVQLRDINTLATHVTESWLPEMEVLGEIKRAMEEHRLVAMRRVTITNFRDIADDVARLSALEGDLDRDVARFRTVVDQGAERELIDRFVEEWEAYKRSLADVFSRLDIGDRDSARLRLDTTATAAFDLATKTIDDLVDMSRMEGLEAVNEVRSAYGFSLALIIGVLAIGTAIVGGAIRWVSLSVTAPILEISHAMERLAAGDNSVARLEGEQRRDEIGVLVQAVSGYRESLDRIRQLADANVQRQRLDAALNNMAQGLCMFDVRRHLLVSNHRFEEIFNIAPGAVTPGMPVGKLMRLAQVAEINPEIDVAESSGSTVATLNDSRVISIVYRPMRDGGLVVTFEDVTEQRRAQERIHHLAHYDSLTDLPNRVTFYEQTETILARLRREETIAVMSLDLDNFKSVNDTLGHPIGDLLLRQAAERMRRCLRAEDVVARLGGDEFAIVQVPSDPPVNARALAARLIEIVGAPYDLDGYQVVVGTSVGISIAPNDGRKPEVLIKNADLALYRAKADGGGVYRFFEMEMDARMQQRRLLELDLRKALLNDEFELHYQPAVDVRTGRITSCEALLRWPHETRGVVPPAEFLSVAEEIGLVVPLGGWVLRQACAEATRWPAEVAVSVNLSPAQFKSRNLIQSVSEALDKSGLPASRLELEITELVLLQEPEGAFALLHQLRDLGVRIAMDDFGTGYSSLSYLRSFPFDKIKIDQSFIRDLPLREDSVAIVRAVVGLSSSLGITTTAEGVETKDQLASLASEGCNEFQGFLFSRPKPAAEIERLLQSQAPEADIVA